MPRKIKKPTIDGITFDSGEEAEIYQYLKKGKLGDLTGIKELNKFKLINSRPKPIILYPSFRAGEYLQRARKYTWDFTCLDGKGDLIHLEYKSKFTEQKPDYRLRRFLVLLSGKLRFAELIKIKKGVYEFKKYF